MLLLRNFGHYVLTTGGAVIVTVFVSRLANSAYSWLCSKLSRKRPRSRRRPRDTRRRGVFIPLNWIAVFVVVSFLLLYPSDAGLVVHAVFNGVEAGANWLAGLVKSIAG